MVNIICSDTARIGKTLLARVYADLHGLRRENSPLIFDTDLSGNGIINYFPNKTRMIDLSRVGDQITLFDTMMEAEMDARKVQSQSAGQRASKDFVIDVAASELHRFFNLFQDIGFERGAAEAGLSIRVYFIVSWTLKSLITTDRIRSLLTSSQFVGVRNMAIEAFAFTPEPDEVDQVPEIDITMFLNALSPDAFAIVNEHSFSFGRFISGEYKGMRYAVKQEIWSFLEGIYNQTDTSLISQ